jgi:hypothetical protein
MNNADAQAFADWQAESLEQIAQSNSHVYRECAIKMMRVLHLAIEYATHSEIRKWGMMFAINHPYCIGKTMTMVATTLKSSSGDQITRASISNAATEFCRQAQIPPSIHMRSEQARDTARESRTKKTK